MFSNGGFGSTGSVGSSSSDYRQLVHEDSGRSAMNWPASFPTDRAKKRAVLVGVSYSFKSYQLRGTVNDVKCMRYFLCEKFQFPNDSILMLTGNSTHFLFYWKKIIGFEYFDLGNSKKKLKNYFVINKTLIFIRMIFKNK